jgi:hypothetical protein
MKIVRRGKAPIALFAGLNIGESGPLSAREVAIGRLVRVLGQPSYMGEDGNQKEL